MATRVETDMRSFEAALDEQFCHIAVGAEVNALCGHHLAGEHPDADTVDGRCPSCGRLSCPDCEHIWQERWS